jgi:Transposase, Mutator family
MSEDTIVRFRKPDAVRDALTELLREGAQRQLKQAVQAELEEFLAARADLCDEHGRAAVVRNGHLPEREVLTGIGPVAVRVPKVRSRTDEPVVFRSSLVPPYVRKAKSVEAALPWVYLRGISTGQMQGALSVLLGEEAAGLSAPVVNRLKLRWQAEHRAWRERRVDADRWVYLWVDGIYSGVRAEDERLCALVVMGVNERGQKHFLAIEDGVRESTQSWCEVLLGLKARGLTEAPRLAVGDGALGGGSGRRSRRSSQARVHSGVGCTKPQTSSTTCRTACRAKPRACCMRSGWPRHARELGPPSIGSWRFTRGSIPRPPSVCRKIAMHCSPSMISRPTTGYICARRTRSNRRLRPSVIVAIARKAA